MLLKMTMYYCLCLCWWIFWWKNSWQNPSSDGDQHSQRASLCFVYKIKNKWKKAREKKFEVEKIIK